MGKGKGTIPQTYLTSFAAEFIGTGLLMFLGCMGAINNYDEPTPTHHYGGIVFGLTVMLIIQTFRHISGAHLNPAVTLGAVLFGIVQPIMALVYVVAQFAGATLGYGLLKILASDKYVRDGFCATSINENITAIQGLGIEIVITTVLILINCAVWDKTNPHNNDCIPLSFGFAVADLSMVAGPLTGASMNTARSFAPLVFGGSWDNHWVYWIGPFLAAPLGCGLYRFLFVGTDGDSNSEVIFLEETSPPPGNKV